MDCGDQAGEAHRDKQHGPERSEIRRGECRSEKSEDGEYTKRRDTGEVDELPLRFTLEYVVDRWEERGDDHDGDAGVVEAPEEEAEPVGVAAEQVAETAREEAEHGAAEEDEERPRGHRQRFQMKVGCGLRQVQTNGSL